MQLYYVSLEIAGPAAMFTRPDTGAAPVSYPVPTFSAAKGMFESVAWLKSAHIRPIKVEICAPICYHRYVTNYGGPLRISKDNSYQLIATILSNVCYRIYGIVEPKCAQPKSTNHLHHLQEMFDRRLRRGQAYHLPCLGWKEFVPSYFGPLRSESSIEEEIELTIPSMLYVVFGPEEMRFRQNVKIEKGVLTYA